VEIGRANQESKFDFLATRQGLVKIDEGQQKEKSSAPTDGLPANQFSPSQHHPSCGLGGVWDHGSWCY